MLSNVLHLQVGLSWSERCPPLTNSDATAATTQSALARHCRKKRRYAEQLAPRKKGSRKGRNTVGFLLLSSFP